MTFPKTYVALTGNIPVSYSIAENETISTEGVVQLLSLTNRTVLATVSITIGVSSSELTFMCGLVDHAGKYLFRMMDGVAENQHILVKTHLMTVTWPHFKLRLPKTLTALTQKTELVFVSSGVQCDSANQFSKFWIDIEFLGKNYSDVRTSKPLSVYREDIQDLMNLLDPHEIPCKAFDQAGLYRGVLRSGYNNSGVIASSNLMRVKWGSEYSLAPHSNSIFPCKRSQVVTYQHPTCTGNRDKIRLFAQMRAENSPVASPHQLKYISEQRALPGKDFVSFGCDLFHESFSGYCFKYISIAQSGAVNEQVTECLPSKIGEGKP